MGFFFFFAKIIFKLNEYAILRAFIVKFRLGVRDLWARKKSEVIEGRRGGGRCDIKN